MKTIVYVDGFNLYYRALKGTAFKWLDLLALCQAVLPKHCDIIGINFYTARISGRIDPSSPRDQQTYLKALSTLPMLQVHLGSFQVKDKEMFLAQPPKLRPRNATPLNPSPRFATVVKSEEKGSDVNLGVHLVRDALLGRFEHAAVITNDTDLCEPLRIVKEDAKLPLTLMTPVSRPAENLRRLATHLRNITPYLGPAQFPPAIQISDGKVINRPPGW
ncbi:hypothetical protein BK675_10935 [Pseudomonas fluorescens]|nr:hypothetical protein BK677_01585 [Pseudomonas fluorescens]ROO08495.1 hypothetical protein BK675_10935 [Pseudomonas fluorescens]ROO16807.1 hypothetical protein BK676_14230 [Pseudomonas fluorescens]